jgi:putative phosphoesterase
MRTGVISDTHDNRIKLSKAVDVFNNEQVDLVIHAGDFVAPFTSRDLSKLNAKFVAVFGNNDGEKIGLKTALSKVGNINHAPHEFTYLGKRFVVMHEPSCLEALASSGKYDVIIYGHTHEVDVREGRTLIVNPGECGAWTSGKSTVALIDLESMGVEVISL